MDKINLHIVERHADEAAFLWERRERAARSPLFDLPALGEVDDRLEANLEGLVLAGEHGLAAAVEGFKQATQREGDDDGELFTAVFAAAELGDAMALARLIVAAGKRPLGPHAVISAITWLSPARARSVLAELSADECPPNLHLLAVGGHAARREDPGELLVRALGSADPALRARAARAAGELGRRDLLPALGAASRAAEDEAAGWAAWAAVLLGDAAALPALWSAAARGGPAAGAACALAAAADGAEEAAARLAALAGSPGREAVALEGAAARGDPACLAWALPLAAARPELARRAAWVLATITGARLEPPLAIRRPGDPPTDRRLARDLEDPYQDLPSPVPDALADRWALVSLGFPSGARWLGGQRLDPAWAATTLREGLQPWRATAAIELRRASLGGPLFPVRAPSADQRRRLRGGG